MKYLYLGLLILCLLLLATLVLKASLRRFEKKEQ